ncbi:UvrD-helicase domain-containing protein [Nocardioides xinjiangensis]|uniref:UvrD-helicase domain-containing protein n=1 Tax=Nocardioides xinjiangensis TaxID=2817376 RepID=UPI001B30FE3C|nr:UvrD-helicase domain-containing protein [Nocardioides sp. SYSU D00514]
MTSTPATTTPTARPDPSPGTFRITAPLPTGTTLLEASAGTGKTWTISALVTRYVAEQGLRLDELLVVTFTRAASQELRERVRERLVSAQRALADPPPEAERDELQAHLLDVDEEGRATRLRRITEALADFDAATIATIHQFCQLVLRSLGVAGDTDRQARLVEDLEQLTEEVVDDCYLAAFADAEAPAFDRATAGAIARAVVGDPRAAVQPEAAVDDAPDSPAAQRVRFARSVLRELDLRKRRLGILSYDDLLGQLADALEDPRRPARARMQARWKVALIDEFQDTDPVQWQVFDRAFSGVATLVLIGDPKQAIYAFRGGDVATYLEAARTAGDRQTLGVNWRSDRPLVDALQRLLAPAQLGHPDIVVREVDAHHERSRLVGAGPPVRLRVARRRELGEGPRSKPPVDRWRGHVVADLAADVKRLLTSDARIDGREVRAGDVAVLAYTHTMLQAIQRALADVGVPSVVTSGGSVFHSPAATEWLTLLEALEQPHRTDRVRAAALTSFLGHTATALDAGGDELTDRLSDRARTLADLLEAKGVAAVLEYAVVGGMTARVLGRVGGERLLTDLRHVGEALHRVSVEDRLGVVGLLAWLREQVAEDKVEVASERARRLDSDAAAVQLVTIHGSKGLEYPVVYLPSLWDRFIGREPDVPRYHDATGRRCRDVGGPSRWRPEAVARHQAEDAGEALRLLYVAMTRARSQVVAWYCPSNNTPGSALHRILFGRRPGTAEVPDSQPVVDDDRIVEILGHWRDAGAVWPELAEVVAPSPEPLAAPVHDLHVRSFARRVDTEWRRTSYTALSAAATDPAHGSDVPLSEPEIGEDLETADQWAPDLDPDAAAGDDLALTALASPMSDFPAGAAFGSLVHAVLEHADLQADDLRQELLHRIEEQRSWWPVEIESGALADALVPVCRTPLGSMTGGRALTDIAAADRLPELDFELPLSGGDLTGHDVDRITLGDLEPLLRRHLATGDPVLSYADTLASDPALAGQALRGYLTGSIDVVMRVPTDAGPSFVTVDYKTNRLGDPTAELTAWDYRPEVLDEAMGHSDYPLQALLYTVVLHRFLRWRLPGYDPAQHLGGVLYLYLRGLCGPDAADLPGLDGRVPGVFEWRPPVPLVLELSDLLDGVHPGRRAR